MFVSSFSHKPLINFAGRIRAAVLLGKPKFYGHQNKKKKRTKAGSTGILPEMFARFVTLLGGKIIADAKVCWLRGSETQTGLSFSWLPGPGWTSADDANTKMEKVFLTLTDGRP